MVAIIPELIGGIGVGDGKREQRHIFGSQLRQLLEFFRNLITNNGLENNK